MAENINQRLFENGNAIIDLITKFNLNELDPEWVKHIVNSDFTESSELPFSFNELHESTNFFGLFNATINALRHYVDQIKSGSIANEERKASLSFLSTTSLCEEQYQNSDNFTKFWVDLTKILNIKFMLAFFSYYIHKGQRYDSNEDDRELGIHSSSMYLLLLSIPGSNAFRVFHPVLFLKTLDILKLTTKLNVGATSPKKGSRGSRSSHRKSSEDHADGNEDEEAELSYLSPSEANKLIRSLNILLNDLLRLSNRFSLKHSADALDETINVLIEITRSEIHNAQGVFVQRHSANSVSSLAYNAYVALQNLCNPLHGNPKSIITTIMKYIINNILMVPRGSSDLSTRALSVIREHSVIFVKYLIVQLLKDSLEGAFILVQHICLRVPDKADFREKAAKSVIEILKVFPIKEYSEIIKWLYNFSQHEKAGHRMFTLEVISKLITEDERILESEDNSSSAPCDKDLTSDSETPVSENNLAISGKTLLTSAADRHILSHNFLLYIIFSRCQDSAATVRSKALFLLSECARSNNLTIIEAMKQVFLNKDVVSLRQSQISGSESSESSDTEEANAFQLPEAEKVLLMLRRRALDEKVMVRKSALQVIESLMKLKEEMVTMDALKVLADHCRDPALLIRKQMIHSLSSIVERYPANEAAVKTLVLGVLPLILDPEIKVQEKVVEFMDGLIFRRIKRFNNLAMCPEEKLPWKILDVITKLSYHKFFNKVLMLWSKSEYQARNQVISIARTHIGGSFNEQAWTFLSLVSQYIEIKHPLFVLDYLEECLTSFEIGSYTLQQVLKTLCHCIKYIPEERSLKLQNDLLLLINSVSASIELISLIIDIITLISTTVEPDIEKGQISIEKWSSSILKSCDNYLKGVLFPEVPNSLSKEEEEKFFRYLFILGEVCQLCPHKVNKRLFLMMQSIIFHDNHSHKEKNADIVIPSTQTQSSQPPKLSFNPTKRLKTLAVITLGKMCLQHEDQAKRIIPALGKMLDTTTIPSMKINIIIVLSDMCVRYATLVDPLMPHVTACLRDADIQVRKTTLTLLINLLQEDYLKLKGSFFYRILQCLCDEDEEVRCTVVFYMTERLLKRFPKIFQQHFIECIFHYNCYEEHESYNKFVQSNKEKELFSLVGTKYRDQRMMLYRFMLDHMMDDQRFATTQRLCQDVLGAVVDGRIKLTASSLPMLEDTFMVLSCDEIKLAWLKNRPEDSDQPTDSNEEAEMAGIVIKKTIISQVVKRNVIENIVPILIALKHKLAEHRSPLMKQLLLYFKEIMKDYKNEVREILAGDKQLAKEIEFDLRKLENQSHQADLERERESMNSRAGELESLVSTEASAKESQPHEPPEVGTTIQENKDPDEETNVEKSAKNTERDEKGIPSSPIFKIKSNVSVLLKRVLINNQRRSVQGEKTSKDNCDKAMDNRDSNVDRAGSEHLGNNVVPNNNNNNNNDDDDDDNDDDVPSDEISEREKETNSEIKSSTNEKEAIENVSCVTPVKNKGHKMKENLMRAISTPNATQKLISDITFINNTQNISSITLSDAEITKAQEKNSTSLTNTSSNTLLLHFRSPEAFAKDEQFSRLRRASQKDLKKCFNVETLKDKEEQGSSDSHSSKQSTKRPSGGFMETFDFQESQSTLENDDSTFVSKSQSLSKKKKRNKFK